MTDTGHAANATSQRLSAIIERLRRSLKDAEQCCEGLSPLDECVDAESVRQALRSLDALHSDILTGVEALGQQIPKTGLTMALVANTVSNAFEVPLADFITPYRLKKRNVQAQRATAYLIRKHISHKSLHQIALFMRKRDHSTIQHTIKVASAKINCDVGFAHLIGIAERGLMSHA